MINVEARGNRGPSYLFQTSPGNARLVDLYADRVPHYATSSLYGEIYKYLPNDTDLTPMPGIRVCRPIISPSSAISPITTLRWTGARIIEPRSLQQQGDNALALADALSRTDPARLKGRDAVYLDMLGRLAAAHRRPWALAAVAGSLLR